MGGGREQVLSPFFSTLTLLAGKVRILWMVGFLTDSSASIYFSLVWLSLLTSPPSTDSSHISHWHSTSLSSVASSPNLGLISQTHPYSTLPVVDYQQFFSRSFLNAAGLAMGK